MYYNLLESYKQAAKKKLGYTDTLLVLVVLASIHSYGLTKSEYIYIHRSYTCSYVVKF